MDIFSYVYAKIRSRVILEKKTRKTMKIRVATRNFLIQRPKDETRESYRRYTSYRRFYQSLRESQSQTTNSPPTGQQEFRIRFRFAIFYYFDHNFRYRNPISMIQDAIEKGLKGIQL